MLNTKPLQNHYTQNVAQDQTILQDFLINEIITYLAQLISHEIT